MNEQEFGRQLCDRLTEKFRALQDFFEVSQGMKRALETHHVGQTEASVRKRDLIIEKINRIDHHIKELTKMKGSAIHRLPLSVMRLIKPYMVKIQELLEVLAGLDEACVTLAIAEHDSRKAELLRMRQGLGRARGYARGAGVTARFLDIKR